MKTSRLGIIIVNFKDPKVVLKDGFQPLVVLSKNNIFQIEISTYVYSDTE